MLLLIVTLTLYFNGNEITTHLIHNQIHNKSRKSIFLRGNISQQSFFPLFVRFILSFPLTSCLVYGYEVSSRVIVTKKPRASLLFRRIREVKSPRLSLSSDLLKCLQVFRDMFPPNKKWWAGNFHISENQECKESFFKCRLIFSLKFLPCVKAWITNHIAGKLKTFSFFLKYI